MKISINAHASVRLETNAGIIYFDPFSIKSSVGDADYIFVTHSHFDHFSPENIEKVANENTVFVIPKSMLAEMNGIDKERVIALSPSDKCTLGGLVVEAVPAYNTNKPMHRAEYGWLGYVVTVDGQRVYVCGDTDATNEGESVKCDIAFIPVGGTYTMDAREAADFTNKMKPGMAVPYHYGSIVGDISCGDVFESLVSDSIKVKKYI